MKNNEQIMEINHETAIRLWNNSYGKATKVADYAGREMAKGAYGDRNSKYGWNLDHILPQSKGGKTTDSNLVCCNIETNDEKADKFPCFNANGKKFEIVKVQNHYEIRLFQKKKAENAKNDTVNLFDHSAGLELLNKLYAYSVKNRFVGTVEILLSDVKGTRVLDFIEYVFASPENHVRFTRYSGYGNCYLVTIKNYCMPKKEDVQSLLDNCVLINTYMSKYFNPTCEVGRYDIRFRVSEYDNSETMFYNQDRQYSSASMPVMRMLSNSMYINELVRKNTVAKDRIPEIRDLGQYDYVYTKLAESLRKEICEE